MRSLILVSRLTRSARFPRCCRTSSQWGQAIPQPQKFYRWASTLPNSPIFQALTKHDRNSTAVVHSVSGRTFTYGHLLHDVVAAKDNLTKVARGKPLQGERIAFLAENGYEYVVAFLSILAHNAIALPLAPSHPGAEIRYILENSSAALVLATEKFKERAERVLSFVPENKPQLEILSKITTAAVSTEDVQLEDAGAEDGGFMLYTSGTTSRPKGVVLSTSVITAQANSLIEAWRYTSSDYVYHVLPLHHIHGAINGLFTPLLAGSGIEFAFPFSADKAWRRFAEPFKPDPTPEHRRRAVTFFTVVPTIYTRLLNQFPKLDDETQQIARRAISPQNMRLNISGSSALPTSIKSAWTELSDGNVLLERYGMTEVGMALSCGLDFADRVDGSVGWPLPLVEARLVDVETDTVIPVGSETDPQGQPRVGEIQLRGPTVFGEYWRNPTATAAEFTSTPDDDGRGKWFRTGDVATRETVPSAGRNAAAQPWATGPMYFIQGRKSVDIIKAGGEKISALEVERELLCLPQVAEAAVVGLKSDQWGQKVAAVVVLSPLGQQTEASNGKPWGRAEMRKALKEVLANYKIPQELKVVDKLPRNAMGKINKKNLVKEIWGEGA